MRIAVIIYRVIYRILAFVAITSAITLLVLFLFGIRPYAVRTGSMEPTIPKGSLSFVNSKAPFEEIKTGDIIAFKVGEMFVTHRAYSVRDGVVITKGDANNNVDAAKVNADNYIGETVFWLPYVGEVPLFARTLGGKIVLIGLFVLFISGGILYDRISGRYEKKKAADGGGSD